MGNVGKRRGYQLQLFGAQIRLEEILRGLVDGVFAGAIAFEGGVRDGDITMGHRVAHSGRVVQLQKLRHLPHHGFGRSYEALIVNPQVASVS